MATALTQCSESECTRNAATLGMCSAHYQRKYCGWSATGPIRQYNTDAKNSQDPNAIKCGVEGCEVGVVARGLCSRHYARFRKHGDPLALNPKGPQPVRVSLPNESSPSKLGKLLGITRQRAHQLLNREAHSARMLLRHAVIKGQVAKPKACERCQKVTDDLEAHHWDYREALDVRWLCPPCHSIVHPHGNKYGTKGKPATA